MERLKSIAVNGVAILLVCLVIVWINVSVRRQSQFERGEQALAIGDYIAAIASYDAAIHMYSPGSSTVETAASRLWEIGERLEKSGDRDRALIAYRTLRSAFYAVRGLSAPGSDWIARADERIATLVKEQERTHGS